MMNRRIRKLQGFLNMEEDFPEMHLNRIRDVKDLSVLTDEARDVVKEEVILESSIHQHEPKVCMLTSPSCENSGGSGGVVSVPVSLPIGSMIAGTAFNVITPDQLPHFKQMLCVDNNGYISGSAVMGNVSGDLKTIVIQQQQHDVDGGGVIGIMNHDANGSNNSHDSAVTSNEQLQLHGGGGGSSGTNISWSTADTYGEMIKVRCKTTSAELYRSRLGSGGRGRCVKYKEKWLTPSEFEQICGRGSSKDWKRSIKSEKSGKSLQSIIDEGHLTPHATNCSCTICCDDEAASGPVRLFTPYKRRKRNQIDVDSMLVGGSCSSVGVGGTPETGGSKRKRSNNMNNTNTNSSNNNNNNNNNSSSNTTNNTESLPTATVVDDNNIFLTDDNITSKDEPWPTLNDSLDASTELVDQAQLTDNPYEKDAAFVVNLNDSSSIALLDNSQTMKTLESVYCTMVKATNDFKRILTDLKYTYDRRIEILQRERDAAMSAMRAQVHADIDDPNIAGALQGNELISAKKCANCNRDALAECSLCRKTPYCSEFCQRKDWNAHQVECTRNPAASAAQQIMLLVDEQS